MGNRRPLLKEKKKKKKRERERHGKVACTNAIITHI